MSSTEGPNTARTGSMSSTLPRVQAIPGVSKPEMLGLQAVSAVQNLEIPGIASSRSSSPEILPVF